MLVICNSPVAPIGKIVCLNGLATSFIHKKFIQNFIHIKNQIWWLNPFKKSLKDLERNNSLGGSDPKDFVLSNSFARKVPEKISGLLFRP